MLVQLFSYFHHRRARDYQSVPEVSFWVEALGPAAPRGRVLDLLSDPQCHRTLFHRHVSIITIWVDPRVLLTYRCLCSGHLLLLLFSGNFLRARRVTCTFPLEYSRVCILSGLLMENNSRCSGRPRSQISAQRDNFLCHIFLFKKEKEKKDIPSCVHW